MLPSTCVAIPALVSVLLGVGAPAAASKKKAPFPFKTTTPAVPSISPSSRDALAKNLGRYFDVLTRQYKNAQWDSYNQTNLALLRYSRRIPIYQIQEVYHDPLKDRLVKDGIEPLLSWYVEYTHRSLGLATSESSSRYNSLRAAFRDAVRRREARRNRAPSLLRTIDGRYRPYSQSVAMTAAYIIMSDQGARWSRVGVPAEQLVVIAKMLDGCKQVSDREKTSGTHEAFLQTLRSGYASAECTRLVEGLTTELGSAGMQDVQALSRDIAGGQAWQGVRACLANEASPMKDMISGLENYVECKLSDMQNITSLAQKVSSGSGGLTWGDLFGAENLGTSPWAMGADGNWEPVRAGSAGQEALGTGYIYTGSMELSDGRNADAFQHEACKQCGAIVVNEPDGGTTSYEFQNIGGGNVRMSQVTGTYADGSKKYQTTYDTAGDPSHHQEWNDQGGTTYEQFANGDSYSAEFNEDGTLKEETIKDGDTTTKVTYDENGNATGTETSTEGAGTTTTTPVDEFVGDPCASLRTPKVRELKGSIDRMQRYIMPNPDSVESSQPDSCLTAATSGDQRGQCQSVALCLEGYVLDENCNCSRRSTGAMPKEQGAGCGYTTCQDGYSCDPSTGRCGRRSDGATIEVPGWRGGPQPTPLRPTDSPHLNSTDAARDARWRNLQAQSGRMP